MPSHDIKLVGALWSAMCAPDQLEVVDLKQTTSIR